jgi:hypothetical protein
MANVQYVIQEEERKEIELPVELIRQKSLASGKFPSYFEKKDMCIVSLSYIIIIN